jgi:hypothetical protein
MPSPTACEREIEQLHDLFVRWYCGRADSDAFERLERALAPSFELVSPDGTVSTRAGVLAGIRNEYDRREGFDIDIRNVEPVHVSDEHALVRYEEWQSTATGAETGRLSTALFGPPAGRTDEVSTDRPTDEVSTDRPTDEVSTDRPTDEVSTDHPTDEVSTDHPTDEVSTDHPTDEVSTDRPTDEVSTDHPTDEVSTDRPTDETRPAARWLHLQETWLQGPDS